MKWIRCLKSAQTLLFFGWVTVFAYLAQIPVGTAHAEIHLANRSNSIQSAASLGSLIADLDDCIICRFVQLPSQASSVVFHFAIFHNLLRTLSPAYFALIPAPFFWVGLARGPPA